MKNEKQHEQKAKLYLHAVREINKYYISPSLIPFPSAFSRYFPVPSLGKIFSHFLRCLLVYNFHHTSIWLGGKKCKNYRICKKCRLQMGFVVFANSCFSKLFLVIQKPSRGLSCAFISISASLRQFWHMNETILYFRNFFYFFCSQIWN